MTEAIKKKGPNDFSEKGKELFEKIKTVQALPDEVVHEFLRCKGVLSSIDSKNKILNHEE